MDIVKASNRLSELELKINIDNVQVDILWFRVMINRGKWIISRHTHSSFEFHLVAEGSCIVTTDNGAFEAKAGEFYLTAPGVYHEQHFSGNGEYVEYSINCDFTELDGEATEGLAILRTLENADCRAVRDSCSIMQCFKQALDEAYEQGFGYYNNIKTLAAMIVTKYARALSGQAVVKYDVPMKVNKNDYRFVQIEKYVEDNISNRITTIQISNYMYLSEKQVCRIIKERTGGSTKELINSIKLKKAKNMLKNTDLKMKEIADILGFTSEYYFNQFFKREEGYPPGRYRCNVQHV